MDSLTSKEQELYDTIIKKINKYVPEWMQKEIIADVDALVEELLYGGEDQEELGL